MTLQELSAQQVKERVLRIVTNHPGVGRPSLYMRAQYEHPAVVEALTKLLDNGEILETLVDNVSRLYLPIDLPANQCAIDFQYPSRLVKARKPAAAEPKPAKPNPKKQRYFSENSVVIDSSQEANKQHAWKQQPLPPSKTAVKRMPKPPPSQYVSLQIDSYTARQLEKAAHDYGESMTRVCELLLRQAAAKGISF